MKNGFLVGRCNPVLIVVVEFSVLYVEIRITVAINTTVAMRGTRQEYGCKNHPAEYGSWNCMIHQQFPNLTCSGLCNFITCRGQKPIDVHQKPDSGPSRWSGMEIAGHGFQRGTHASAGGRPNQGHPRTGGCFRPPGSISLSQEFYHVNG